MLLAAAYRHSAIIGDGLANLIFLCSYSLTISHHSIISGSLRYSRSRIRS